VRQWISRSLLLPLYGWLRTVGRPEVLSRLVAAAAADDDDDDDGCGGGFPHRS